MSAVISPKLSVLKNVLPPLIQSLNITMEFLKFLIVIHSSKLYCLLKKLLQSLVHMAECPVTSCDLVKKYKFFCHILYDQFKQRWKSDMYSKYNSLKGTTGF